MVKNTRYLRASLIGAIFVTCIVYFWSNIATSFESAIGRPSEDIPVLVADHFIPPFQVLKARDIKIKYFPRDLVPPGALHTVAEIWKEDGQALYSSIVGIPEGQPLTRTILNETGKDHGMSSLLRPGKVAVSFKVDRERSAGGWVHPGDTIAVFQKIAMSSSSRGEGRQTHLLLNAVEVLAVNQTHLGHDMPTSEQPEEPQNAPAESDSQVLTVIVNTSDASALVEAQEAGPLTIVLRPLGDDLPWLPVGKGVMP